MACMVALSMIAAGVPMAAAGGDGDFENGTVHALEQGEELYLVFGADLGDQSLEEYIDEHAKESADSSAEVIQYQDVDQVNINEQGSAVSIAIDGGEATAIQEANQENDNVQSGEAITESGKVETATTQFENVATSTSLSATAATSSSMAGESRTRRATTRRSHRKRSPASLSPRRSGRSITTTRVPPSPSR